MAAHPNISQKNAETIVKYILSLSQKKATEKQVPLKGNYVAKIPAGENDRGGYLLRAAYTDKGSASINPLSSESIVPLRSAAVDPQKADVKKNTQLLTTPTIAFSMIGDNSYLGYNNIDLENIKQLQFVVQATPSSGDVGGVIEIHLDSPDGKLIGRTEIIESKDIDYARLMENMGGAAKPKKSSGVKVDTSKQKQAPPIDFEAIMKLLAVHRSEERR